MQLDGRLVEFIHDVLISIHENLHELSERKNFADPSELDHIEARIMAYREMIAIMRASAERLNLPKEELGL